MSCEIRNNMIICSRGRQMPKCQFCSRMSTKQCDYKLDKTHTCDAYMCEAHSKKQGPNLDTCPNHPEMRFF